MASHRSLNIVLCDYLGNPGVTRDEILEAERLRTWRTIADEHSIILPIIVINFVLSQGSWKNLPSRILQANLETLEVIRTLLSRWSRGSGKLSR